jgi:hypothetical protein
LARAVHNKIKQITAPISTLFQNTHMRAIWNY